MTSIFTVYINTYGKNDLSIGAARSIKKYCSHETKIILLDSSFTINDGPFDIIHHVFFPKWMGWAAAHNMSGDGPAICIDDDIRLVMNTSLKDRYYGKNYKAGCGSMVVGWHDKNGLFKSDISYLKTERISSKIFCQDWDQELCRLSVLNMSEKIDNIWLHIDKGSEKMKQSRLDLIKYIG